MTKKRSSNRPTIADVAAHAGVSAITVSRALRDPQKVSEELRRLIDEAVSDLNYVPDLNARALASSRTDVVAVLVPSLTQHIFSDVVRGIYDGLEESGLRIEVANTRYSAEREEQLVFGIMRHRPAAVIISGTEQTARTRKMLEAAKCPVIQIMDITNDPIQKIIGFSHQRAGLEMTRFLIQAGYRRIAFFAGWMNARSLQRYQGYKQAMEEAGLYDPALLAQGDSDNPEYRRAAQDDFHQFSSTIMGRGLMLDMLDRGLGMDAVFCNNDVLSLGALFACQARGVSIPDQVGIAGFNDFDFMAAAEPGLTSIRIHRWQCGFDAMMAVRNQLNGEPVGAPVVDLGFEIIKRASTDRRGELTAAPSRAAAVFAVG